MDAGPARPVAIHIALIGGDGIGPEVVREARRVLEAVADAELAAVSLEEFPHGTDHYLATGETLGEATFERLRSEFDGILFGAVGDPRVPDNRPARDILLGLRVRLDLYMNFRPVKLRDPALSPLKCAEEGAIDFVIFRENTEGLYGGSGELTGQGTPEERAVSEMVATRGAVERIVRAAFDYAATHGRSRVTLADKENAVPHVFGLWRRVFQGVADEHPGIEAEVQYVDALAMHLIRDPHRFEVIVTENLLGDILSDLGAQLVGGPGLAPSANLHPGRVSLYEPVHGSAPDIAGTGRANPLAAILSAVLLLRDAGAGRAADCVEAAVDRVLCEGVRTPDLGGTASTEQVGRWVAEAVRRGS